jgi:hypothetical protein
MPCASDTSRIKVSQIILLQAQEHTRLFETLLRARVSCGSRFQHGAVIHESLEAIKRTEVASQGSREIAVPRTGGSGLIPPFSKSVFVFAMENIEYYEHNQDLQTQAVINETSHV